MGRNARWLVSRPGEPHALILTEGYATSVVDLFRVVALADRGDDGTNSCYMDARSSVGLYGRATRFLDVTLHPEAYVKDAPLGVIRTLNRTGSLLLLGAVAVVVYDVLRTIARP